MIAILLSKAERVDDPRERIKINDVLYRIDRCGHVLHDWPLIEHDGRHYCKTERVFKGMAVYELMSCSTLARPFHPKELFKKGMPLA